MWLALSAVVAEAQVREVLGSDTVDLERRLALLQRVPPGLDPEEGSRTWVVEVAADRSLDTDRGKVGKAERV